jgi:hypothetical protein
MMASQPENKVPKVFDPFATSKMSFPDIFKAIPCSNYTRARKTAVLTGSPPRSMTFPRVFIMGFRYFVTHSFCKTPMRDYFKETFIGPCGNLDEEKDHPCIARRSTPSHPTNSPPKPPEYNNRGTTRRTAPRRSDNYAQSALPGLPLAQRNTVAHFDDARHLRRPSCITRGTGLWVDMLADSCASS